MSLARSATLVLALALVAKVSGLLRHVAVAAYFGTSETMDALLVALMLVSLTLLWLEGPIRLVVMPLIARAAAERGDAAAWRDASALLNGVMTLIIAVAALQAAFAPTLVSVVAPGLAEATASLAGQLTRVLAIAIVLTGLARFLSAIGHAHQRFGRPGAAATVENVAVIAAVVVLAPALGIWGLTTGVVLGALAQVVTQLPLVWAHRHHFSLRLDLGHPAIRRMAGLGLPVMIGSGGSGLGRLSDRFFASLLPAGRLSALSYAHQLTYALFHLLAGPLTTVLFPFFSRKAGAARYDEVSRHLARALRLLFAVVVPVAVGLAILHEPVVRLVLQRGAFTAESTRLTAEAVLVYALGLPVYALSHLLSYAFYSVEDTKTPVSAGLARLGVQVGLSLVLVRPLGHVGLALAESVSFVVKAVMLLVLLPPSLRGREYGRVLRSFGTTVALSGAMGAVLLTALPPLEALLGPGVSFAASAATVLAAVALGAVTYGGLFMLAQPADARELYRRVHTGVVRRRTARVVTR
jgi:putative peptidoglycan lipid II flippase